MNFIKRAWQNISFKKGRSVLLIIVMSVIMVFIMAGLLIRNAALNTISTTKEQTGASVTLSANREQAFKKMRQTSSNTTNRPQLDLPAVSLTDIKAIAKLDNVANYNVTVATSVNAKSFDAITTTDTNDSVLSGRPSGGQESTSEAGDIQVTGTLDMSTITSFKNKQNKITKGRALDASDIDSKNIVIESELAKQNNLSVNDTIKIKATTGDKKTYTLTVVGIYKASQSSSTNMGRQQSDPSNTIYTSYTLANILKDQTNKVDQATFTLSDPAKKASFLKAAKKEINTKKFSLIADDSTYQALKSSMKNMGNFANKMVWLVAIAGTIILALIIILMIRERRYEMGVLLSLGESRLKIIGQLLVEMLMLLLVSLTLAGIGGRFTGQILSQQMLSSVTTNTTNNQNNQGMMPPGGGGQAPGGQQGGGNRQEPGNQQNQNTRSMPGKNAKNQQLKLKISAVTLIQLGALGFTIITFAVLLASANILKLEPRKILIG